MILELGMREGFVATRQLPGSDGLFTFIGMEAGWGGRPDLVFS